MKIDWFLEAEPPGDDAEQQLADEIEQSLSAAESQGVSSQRIAELTLRTLAFNGHDHA